MCICIYIHTYMYMYMCICLHICIYIFKYAHRNATVCVHRYRHKCSRMHTVLEVFCSPAALSCPEALSCQTPLDHSRSNMELLVLESFEIPGPRPQCGPQQPKGMRQMLSLSTMLRVATYMCICVYAHAHMCVCVCVCFSFVLVNGRILISQGDMSPVRGPCKS